MNTIYQMSFEVDKVNNKINVKREFNSSVEHVWAAWTRPELLDQWWAPKPYKARTKTMDFRVGGMWLYAMVGPDGQEIWCKANYLAIEDQKSFSGRDAFCDEHGVATDDFPGSTWNTSFKPLGEATLVEIEIDYKNLSDLEKIIQMGFKEGFTAALGNLDELLNA
ncbi:MAG TPA: SRPBCC domain-containing protein [Chitinophagaceae bacterium]|nr:SRPBCC domain-containing protein [Chitinophagaceae bacterium]